MRHRDHCTLHYAIAYLLGITTGALFTSIVYLLSL